MKSKIELVMGSIVALIGLGCLFMALRTYKRSGTLSA